MLQHNSSTPLYQQIAEILTLGIRSGKYQPGDKLPSENELCQEYAVSRMTVRLALSQLIQQGLVQSVHGKGTFVKEPVVSYNMRKIIGFSDTMRRRGLDGHTIIESCVEMKEPPVEGFCVNLNLLGYAGNTPLVIYCSYLRPEQAEKMKAAAETAVAEGRAFSTYELYQQMEKKPARVEQELRAVDADATVAGLLKISKGKAIMLVQSYYYDEDGELLEFKRAYYRPGSCSFHIQREV